MSLISKLGNRDEIVCQFLITLLYLGVVGTILYASYKEKGKKEYIERNLAQNAVREKEVSVGYEDLDRDGRYETVLKYIKEDSNYKYKEIPVLKIERDKKGKFRATSLDYERDF